MNAKDFGQLMRNFPETLEDTERFAAILRDFYPKEKKDINLMILCHKADIVSMLRSSKLDDSLTARMMTLLIDDYFIAEDKARWAAELWCDAYGYYTTGVLPSSRPQPAQPAPVRQAVPQQAASLQETSPRYFRTEMDGNSCIITRYIGSPTGQVVIPASINGKPVTQIGLDAFRNCTGLTSIHIPSSVKTIGGYAFCWCTSLASINIPDHVTEIGGFAFENCTSLTSVNIPASVDYIDYFAFVDCPKLTIYAPAGSCVEEYCRIRKIRFQAVPPSPAPQQTAPLQETSPRYFKTSVGKQGCAITKYIGPKTGQVVIPAIINGRPVTQIRATAFYECTGLTSISIPEHVTAIGPGAFNGCVSLTSINIPDQVTEIGSYAFAGCTSLTSIGIPDSVTHIFIWAFSGCTSLTSVSIPASVVNIGNKAFTNCPKLTVYAPTGSCAEEYCRENKIRYYTTGVLPPSCPQPPQAAPTGVKFFPGVVYAPVAGKVIPSEEIPDITFAAGVLGEGVGIEPAGEIVVAPFDGEISSVTDTHHAVGITSLDGMEVLIHVGVDTVDMQGEGFQCFVQKGQKVRTGDKLIAFDRKKIAAAKHPDVVVLLVTNSDDFANLTIQTGSCQKLDKVISINIA